MFMNDKGFVTVQEAFELIALGWNPRSGDL